MSRLPLARICDEFSRGNAHSERDTLSRAKENSHGICFSRFLHLSCIGKLCPSLDALAPGFYVYDSQEDSQIELAHSFALFCPDSPGGDLYFSLTESFLVLY